MNNRQHLCDTHNDLYQKLFELSDTPGSIFDRDGKILALNQALRRLLSETIADRSLPMQIEDLFHPNQRRRVVQYYQNCDRQKISSSPFILETASNQRRLVKFKIETIDGADLFYGSLKDVTAKERQKKRQHQLAKRIAIINEIVAAVNSNLNQQQLIKIFLNQIARIVHYDLAYVLLCDIDDRELEIHMSKDVSEVESTKGSGHFCYSLNQILVNCQKIEQDPDTIAKFAEALGIVPEKKYRSQALIQLQTDEQLIGVVLLYCDKRNAFTRYHVSVFREISGQIAVAFMKSRLLQRYQQSLTNLSYLARINEFLTSSLELDDVLKQLVESSQQIMQAKICTIHLLNDQKSIQLYTRHADHRNSEMLDCFRPQIQQIITTKRPLVVENLDYHNIQFFKNRLLIQQMNLKSMIILPVVVDGMTIALLSVFLDKVHYFSEHEIELLSMLADQAAIAMKNAALYRQVQDTKNFLESIIHSSTHIIVATDLEGKITFFNRSACRKTGYTSEEALNLPFFDRFIKNGAAIFEGLKQQLFRLNRNQWFECDMFQKDGKYFRIAWSFSALVDHNQHIIGSIGIGRELPAPQIGPKHFGVITSTNEVVKIN
ncbi:MAG: GAF domain-containing protein [candidate division KSB1 bacterium]|nr:GAF domain-containing protein [candidate division KSB1 bacterium]